MRAVATATSSNATANERIEHVRVIPGSRARRVRVMSAAFLALAYSLAIVVPAIVIELWLLAFFFLPAPVLLLYLLRLTPRPRTSTLEIGPGVVRERRPFGLRIRARDVTGVSACAHEDGYAMTVQLRHDPAPHTFVVKDEATLLRLREALGGGHDGGGLIGWPLQRDPREVALTAVGMGAAALFLGFAGAFFAFAFPFTRAFPKPPQKLTSILLTEQGLVWNFAGPRLFPYAMLGKASRIGKLLFLDPRQKSPGSADHVKIPLKSLSDAEIDLIISQVESAIRRSKGERTLRDSALERVSALKRNESEPIKEWLVRLEAVAAALRGNDYRSAPVSADDLWRIASDADEAFEDRAAAGRVLIRAQGQGARVRVETALANSRAPEQRIRIALDDDIDLAANALAEDAVERKKRMVG